MPREHLFKQWIVWREAQKTLWLGAKKVSKHWRDGDSVARLFADKQCTEAILRLLGGTDVGRGAPKWEEEHGPGGGSEGSHMGGEGEEGAAVIV